MFSATVGNSKTYLAISSTKYELKGRPGVRVQTEQDLALLFSVNLDL